MKTKAKQYTDITVPAKRTKLNNNIVEFSVYRDIFCDVAKQIDDVKTASKFMILNSSTVEIGRKRIKKIASNMYWSIFITPRFTSLRITALLNSNEELSIKGYMHRYDGKGGITAFMIYECIRGSDVYAIMGKDVDVPPSLCYAKDLKSVKLESFTPSTLKFSKEVSVDQEEDSIEDEVNIFEGYDDEDYGYSPSDISIDD